MRKIYLIFTHTGTILSKIIKNFTKNEFTHISISLDSKLERMYSFGRIYPHIAFIGGFVKENPKEGTFKRFYKTVTEIYELEITEEQYKKIEEIIKTFNEHRKEYKFNVLGLFMVAINKSRKKEKTFYCAEFVQYVFDKAQIDISYLPEVIKPQDLKKTKNIKRVYKGRLNEYLL